MFFSLEKLFIDVFAPQSSEIVTIMYDLPHDDIHDTKEWSDRRHIVEEWHQKAKYKDTHGIGIFWPRYPQDLDLPTPHTYGTIGTILLRWIQPSRLGILATDVVG